MSLVPCIHTCARACMLACVCLRAMRCDAMRCGAVRCGEVRCNAVRCDAMRCVRLRLRTDHPRAEACDGVIAAVLPCVALT